MSIRDLQLAVGMQGNYSAFGAEFSSDVGGIGRCRCFDTTIRNGRRRG